MPMQFSLKSLLSPLTVPKFKQEYWTRRPYLTHMPERRLRAVCAGLRYDNLRSVIADSETPTTRLWFSGPSGTHATNVPTADAHRYYEAGMTLFLDRSDALARSWMAAIERDLEVTPMGRLPSIFASPRGHGAHLHFDCYEIFTVQLVGTKTWWVAPQPELPFVTANWAPGVPPLGNFEPYRREPIAPPPRERMQKFELRPGSVFYLPRGHWHTTEASGESASLSINFAVAPPSRIDLFAPLLRFVAEQDPVWRQWAETTPAAAGDEMQTMAAALERLAQKLPGLARDYFGASRAEGARFRRNQLTGLGFSGARKGNRREALVMHRSAKRQGVSVQLSTQEAAVCTHFLDHPEAMTADEVARRFPKLGRAALATLLDTLVRANFLTRIP